MSPTRGYLLDTHVLLWWMEGSARLASDMHTLINDPGHVVFVSAAAAWEIGIKKGLGRLVVPEDFAEKVVDAGLEFLPVTFEHGLAVATLPPHHGDPFDRMMILQARMEMLVLITHDAKIAEYDAPMLMV